VAGGNITFPAIYQNELRVYFISGLLKCKRESSVKESVYRF